MTAKHVERIEFQKALFEHLPQQGSGRPGLTAKMLVDALDSRFETKSSEAARLRKIQRDLNTMVQDGKIVVEDENAHTYRYLAVRVQDSVDPIFWGYLMQNFKSYIASVVPAKRLVEALNKINQQDMGVNLSEHLFQVSPDTLELLPAQFNPVVLSTILRALVEGRAIEAHYRYRDGTLCRHVLHLQGAVQSGPRLFLHVLVDDEESFVQTYALHRFVTVKMLNKPAHKAAHFDLAKAVEARDPNPESVHQIRLEMLTRSFVTDLLRDCPLSEDQEIKDEDRYPGFNARVTATVSNSLLLERWLMGRGTSLCVIEPRALAERIAAKAYEIARLHANPPSSDCPDKEYMK